MLTKMLSGKIESLYLDQIPFARVADSLARYDLKGSKLIKTLLLQFPEFQKMKELAAVRNGLDRYTHTVLTLTGLLAIMTKNYDLFVRHNVQSSSGLQLTKFQFLDICHKTEAIMRNDRALVFTILMMLTHDFGTNIDEKTHVRMSGDLCSSAFEQLGFSVEEIHLAVSIIGHHDILGRVFLGELDPAHVIEIYSQVEPAAQAQFFPYLWLMTVLDINASGAGYLTQEKYARLQYCAEPQAFKALTQDWAVQRIALLRPDIVLTPQDLPVIQAFVHTNLQYVAKLFTAKDEQGAYILSSEQVLRFVVLLNDYWQILRTYPELQYIVFESDSVAAAVDLRQRLKATPIVPYAYTRTPEGYLLIANYNL